MVSFAKSKFFLHSLMVCCIVFGVSGCQNKSEKDSRNIETPGGLEFYTTPLLTSNDGRLKISSNEAYALSDRDSVWNVSWTVTPNGGGTLTLANSALVVPPGAVRSARRLTWTMATMIPRGLRNALPRVYDFGPEGTQFDIPVSLRVKFADAGLGTQNPDEYRCYHYDETVHNWVAQATQVDKDRGQFVVELHHFSRYAFAR